VGANTIAVDFVAGDASLNRTAEFMYTLFVPARARLAFPCFDQPDLKARYTLSLEIPAAWEALANGAETARESIAGDRTRLRFAQTQPLPTYLFAFAAGKFMIETAERNGRTFRMFHRETDAEKVARNRDTIFDLHASSLAWLERYTGIPYPFGKFDFLLVPAFQFGGMEHAGAIFYNASGVLLDQSATQNQKLGRASVIAHETAHMWFGDLVTMRWFNDVWMKEVFGSRDQPRAALSLRELSGRIRRGPDAGHQRDPPGTRQPVGGRKSVRRDHLPEGPGGHAAAGDDPRRGTIP
jgi:aminopeptidase N